MSANLRARGQSLILACLYMVLLVVMVMMTLGISQRIREKIELNSVAETTAYSNAVATARAYNAIALMNRAAIAHWINLAGVESLISWTGLLYAQYYAVNRIILPTGSFGGGGMFAPPVLMGLPNYTAPSECQYAMMNLLMTSLHDAYWDMNNDWVVFIEDAARAGEQGRRLQDAIANLKGAEQSILGAMRGQIASNAIGQQIAELAGQSDVSSGGAGTSGVNLGWVGAPQTGLHSDKVWWAVMDARSPWVKNRSNDPILRLEQALANSFNERTTGNPVPIRDILNTDPHGGPPYWELVKAPGSVTFNFTTHGHGCFGADFGSCESGPDWTNALAQDFTDVTVNINIGSITSAGAADNGRVDLPAPCPPYNYSGTKSDESRVMASDIHHDDDFAWFDYEGYGGAGWSINGGNSPVMSQLHSKAITQHTMGPCTDDFLLRPCHSVYVGIVSLNQGAPLGGQAKNYAAANRNHARHGGPEGTRDPWDLRFGYSFRGGPPTRIDLGKGGDANAVAVGTGIAYYHRRGHFTETPNLFNPYWRATLIGARRGADDMPNPPGEAGAAWAELKSAGYRGEN